ncbi:MAG: response regulator, partial [Thermodesulfobacteriota bacterium]
MGKRLLVGGKNEDFRKSLSEQITTAGYKAYTAASASQITDMIGAYSGGIDFLIMDLQLPPVNGYWVMTWLIERGYDNMFPIMILCDKSEISHSIDDLRRQGATSVMPASSTPEEILYQVNQELNKERKMRGSP